MKWPKAPLLILSLLASCQGPYSAFNAAGDSAVTILHIFWFLTIIASLVWLIFITLQIYSYKLRPRPHDGKMTRFLVIGGGVLFPLGVISLAVYFTLLPLPRLLQRAPPGSLTVKVSGLQWWWRVKYQVDGGEVELANEIWLPVNEPVQFYFSSEDVIHSFWVPSLAGKMDLIPGRKTDLSFTPTKTGHFKGVCAEFCGASHGLMQIDVKVVERKVFDEWLENQKRPVTRSQSPGELAFISNGCLACHSVRGISTQGKLGPDLTHVGSRSRIGAGVLNRSAPSFHRWLAQVEQLKPEVKMPAFDMLPPDERHAISQWLEGLK